VIGNDQFYFTNARKYCAVMEMMFRLRFGSVGFYDGSHAELMETGLFMPSGIAASNDRRCVAIFCVDFSLEEMIKLKQFIRPVLMFVKNCLYE